MKRVELGLYETLWFMRRDEQQQVNDQSVTF